ncbi:formylmethanofuran dehydrogenase, subunit C [Archaeoglobus sulfaticallidus PM70-1]|uniref:formylmethanofuran dehydrogenase n=1 Tax=Archaeoglobus sulfaticallidus PM70-1 TaxID=387631 RepID=N0BH23_9EURY|nr:formylmethanofuran dehydrogenase subunit C [Archaeoglobus sulfaticallidus]AGK61577.1 formylmethanofuran dehydrogenase, subunit C [Archaeoglobus sulfaticallidus PM70-1]
MLILKPKFDFEVSVEMEITPSVAKADEQEIKDFEVYYGKKKVKLSELFEIKKEGDEAKLVLEGDFSKVKWVGTRMDEGEIVVKGNIGDHCGAYMTGGKIVVEGNALDWLGAEMKGGEIIVKGNARNYVGCAYYGDMTGMSGGKITVDGNVGNYIGEKMGGGEIEIKGSAGDFIGTEMKDGVIVIHGDCGFVGGDMKGGTIKIKGNFELVPGFKEVEDGFEGDVNAGGKGKVVKIA